MADFNKRCLTKLTFMILLVAINKKDTPTVLQIQAILQQIDNSPHISYDENTRMKLKRWRSNIVNLELHFNTNISHYIVIFKRNKIVSFTPSFKNLKGYIECLFS